LNSIRRRRRRRKLRRLQRKQHMAIAVAAVATSADKSPEKLVPNSTSDSEQIPTTSNNANQTVTNLEEDQATAVTSKSPNKGWSIFFVPFP
jgi:hypothetical protein